MMSPPDSRGMFVHGRCKNGGNAVQGCGYGSIYNIIR